MPNLLIYSIFITNLFRESDKGDNVEDKIKANLHDEMSEQQMQTDTGDVDHIDGVEETHQGNMYNDEFLLMFVNI